MNLRIIRPDPPPMAEWLLEVWSRRELIRAFASRDIRIRYRQSIIGIAWALVQPLSLMLVIGVVFQSLARVESGIPYFLFILTGLVPWSFFSQAASRASSSLVDNSMLVTRVFFPRLTLPLSKVVSFLPDLLIGSLLLLAAVWIFEPRLMSLRVLFAALVALGFTVLAAAMGAFFSGINARYRDINYVIPLLIQVWFFASPIIYPATLVPRQWQSLYWLNPVAPLVALWRWSFVNGDLPPTYSIVTAFASVTLFSIIGILVFHRVEFTVADVV